MVEEYNKVEWTEEKDEDDQPITPTSAGNFNQMDEGIDNNRNYINQNEGRISTNEDEIASNEGRISTNETDIENLTSVYKTGSISVDDDDRNAFVGIPNDRVFIFVITSTDVGSDTTLTISQIADDVGRRFRVAQSGLSEGTIGYKIIELHI